MPAMCKEGSAQCNTRANTTDLLATIRSGVLEMFGITEAAVLRTDEHGKQVVWEKGDYLIAADNPDDARYLTLWFKGKKKVGELWLVPGRESDVLGYLVVQKVKITGHRGKGLGLELYRQAFGCLGPRWRGMASERINRENEAQVPAIWKRLGAQRSEEGSYILNRPGLKESKGIELPARLAVRTGDQVWSDPPNKITTHPDLYLEAIRSIYKLHDTWMARGHLERNWSKIHAENPPVDGFVTTTGRFVTREEAFELLSPALRVEVMGPQCKRDYLLSTDLRELYDVEPEFLSRQLADPNAHPHYKGHQGD